MSKSTQIINPENMDQLLEFANAMSKSGLVPNDYQGRPNNIVVAVQWGSEVGLAPILPDNCFSIIGSTDLTVTIIPKTIRININADFL